MKIPVLLSGVLLASAPALADAPAGSDAPASPPAESSSGAGENQEAPTAPAASVSPMTPSASANSSAKPPVVAQLETLVKDLSMPSETDASIRVFWTREGVDEPKPADYARLAGLSVKSTDPVEMRSLGDLLDGPATEQGWMNPGERATCKRFADLRAFLHANFAELEVLSFGKVEKQIVIAGRLDGGFAGLVTLMVETGD